MIWHTRQVLIGTEEIQTGYDKLTGIDTTFFVPLTAGVSIVVEWGMP
jgi:hypothetical protein